MMKKDKARVLDSNDQPGPDVQPASTGRADETQSFGESDDPAPSTRAPQEIDELKAQAAKGREHWEQLLRTAADLENYKKRALRERQEAVQYANAGLLQKLIPILDNFDMAVAAANNAPGGSAPSLQTGVNMILSQLRTTLTEAGLEEIDAANQPFDPNFHEAVAQQESAEVPEGQVLQQLRKGYKLRDRLLRPATVIVAKRPATPS
jgi:molecular chaperone GrpE